MMSLKFKVYYQMNMLSQSQVDAAMMLESDLLPSVDFIRYHRWMNLHFQSPGVVNQIFSINSFNPYSHRESSVSIVRVCFLVQFTPAICVALSIHGVGVVYIASHLQFFHAQRLDFL